MPEKVLHVLHFFALIGNTAQVCEVSLLYNCTLLSQDIDYFEGSG